MNHPTRTFRLHVALLCAVAATGFWPGAASALEFYVDAVNGDDARPALVAQSPATPWKSIGHALATVDTASGRHTIHVDPGTYPEAAETSFGNVEIRATGDPGSVVVVPGGSTPGLEISHPDVLVEGILVQGGSHGFLAEDADGLVIRDCTSVAAAFDGFHIDGTTELTIESSRAISAGSRGILLQHSMLAYVRNNLVYENGEWGIDFENTTASDPQPPLSTGNVVAFNTIAFNGSAAGGGLRLKNAVGEVRDNIITDNDATGLRIDTPGASVHHNLIFGNTTAALSPASYAVGNGMLTASPLYEDPDGTDGILGGVAGFEDDVFALQPTSPAVNTGSGTVTMRDISGSTREDQVDDTGVADMGFHAEADPSTGAPPVSSGPATYYVDDDGGNDSRDKIAAQSPSTPWATIGRALSSGLGAGDTVVVAAGIYAEAVGTSTGDFTLLTTAGALIRVPSGATGISIDHPSVLVDGFSIDGATNPATVHGVKVAAAEVTLRNLVVDGAAQNGIVIEDTAGATVEDCTVDGAGNGGIVFLGSSGSAVGNTVSSSVGWGIEFDSEAGPLSTDNLVELNTLASNAFGGIVFRNANGIVIENTVTGGTNGIRAEDANGIVVRKNSVSGHSQNGLRINDTQGFVLDGNVVATTTQAGIRAVKSSQGYVRNNLVRATGEAGIWFDASGGSTAPENIVAFNTVYGGGASGVRFQNATGEIRDNVIVNSTTFAVRIDTGPSVVHHNALFSTSAVDLDATTSWANLTVDPQLANPGGGDLRLDVASPAVDAGSGTVVTIDISGSAVETGAPDTGAADLGHHPDAGESTGAPPITTGSPALVYYVDCATGDDARTEAQAQNPATPWRTIGHAESEVQADEIIQVANGTCILTATLEVDRPGLMVRAANPLGTIIRGPSGQNAIDVEASGVTIEGFVIETGRRGIRVDAAPATLADVVLRGLEVRGTAGTISLEAILVREAIRPLVENSIVRDSLTRGVRFQRVTDGYIRNNLIEGNTQRGILADAVGGSGPYTGLIVAFNTVVMNGSGTSGGGIQLQSVRGEIRDNIIASNASFGIRTDVAPVYIHHNDIFGNTTAIAEAGAPPDIWQNLAVDPLFVGTDFRLSHVAAGNGANSPLIEAGSGAVGERDISGSTRTDGAADTGVADLGWHTGGAASSGAPDVELPPGGPGPFTYYVNTATGNDATSVYDARSPATPWKTIGRALAAGAAMLGDTVSVAAGTYAEAPETSTGGVTIFANGVVTLSPPGGQIGLEINHPDVVVDGLRVVGGTHGIQGTNADGLVVQGCSLSGQSASGIRVADTSGFILDDNVVKDVAGRGLHLFRSDAGYLRNNLVVRSGGWGAHFENPSPNPISADNIVAFNTVYGSGHLSAAGGIRFERATGEIRDNVVSNNQTVAIKTDTAAVYLHHNVLFANGTIETATGQEPVKWANLQGTADPRLVAPASDNFALSQIAAGQAASSPALDFGSGQVGAVDISGSTRTDGIADSGMADVGWHAGASASTGAPPPDTDDTPAPGSGVSYYVDPVAGSNANSYGAAQSPSTPWQTIGHAIAQSSAGDVIRLRPGTYAEQVNVDVPALTLRGDGPLGSVIITPPGGQVGISIQDLSDVHIEDLVVEGGSQGVRADRADGVRITRVVTVDAATVGLRLIDTVDGRIDGCIVTGAGTNGIELELSSNLYVHNNLVYANAEWGISLDNVAGQNPLPPVSTGNVIAFNTVHQNTDGIRALNASGEIRDNNITGHSDLGLYLGGPNLLVHHDNFATNARDRDSNAAYKSTLFVWSLLGKSPRYVDPDGDDGILGGLGWADDDFRLQRLSAGEDHQSPAIDAGSGASSSLDIGGSTASTGEIDGGVADIGFHYDAPSASASPAPATPPSTVSQTYYVSPTGSDARTATEAQEAATPWQTIDHALDTAKATDVIVLLPGVYAEAVSIGLADLTLMADETGTAIVNPGAQTGITVSASGVTIDGLVVSGGATGINGLTTGSQLHVSNCAVVGQSTDAIRVTDASEVTIESSVTTGALFSGITLRRVSDSTVRNVLSYANGEWGVNLDNSPGANPLSTGNEVVGSTVSFNGIGNIRLLNATGLVRDNLITDTDGFGLRIDTAGSTLRHNGFQANETPIDPEGYIFCAGCEMNRAIASHLVDPAGVDGLLGGDDWEDDDFRVSQVAAGQSEQSEAVDFGSDLAASLGVSGSTATSGTPDDGIADIGYHYGSSERALPAPETETIPNAILYVDATTGDDARTRTEATNPSTPWKTIAHAVSVLVPGDTILVAPGTYREAVRIDKADVTLRGNGAHASVILAPPLDAHGAENPRDPIRVRASGVRIENFWIRQPRRGIIAQGNLDGLAISDVVITQAERDGLTILGGEGISVEGVVVTGSGRYGAYVRTATGVEFRDCDIYANARAGLALARAEVGVHFTTIYGNREGIRNGRSTLLVRDSIIAGTERDGLRARTTDVVTIDHTLFGLNGRDVAPSGIPTGAGALFNTDPLLVDADGPDDVLGGAGWADDDLSLSQSGGGQAVDSPAVDAGSDLASTLDVTGSTASNGTPDTGQADLGAHR